MPMVLIVDTMSVFAAVTATFTKILAEKSLLCHVQFIKELLDRLVLHMLAWFDTRDMCADGLTKGAVERTAIHSIMDGTMKVSQEPKTWISKKGGRSTPEAPLDLSSDETWFSCTFFCMVQMLDTPLLPDRCRNRDGAILNPGRGQTQDPVRVKLSADQGNDDTYIRIPSVSIGLNHKKDSRYEPVVYSPLPPLPEIGTFEVVEYPSPADGSNIAEVRGETTTWQKPCNTDSIVAKIRWEIWRDGKHYPKKTDPKVVSNCRFGLALEDVAKRASLCYPAEDMNGDAHFVPLHNMTDFVQTIVQVGLDVNLQVRFKTRGARSSP